MSRASEARFWQAAGMVVGVSGGLLMAYTFGRYGLASVDHTALAYGTASAFVILAAAAAVVGGRTLHVEEMGLTARESLLWKLLSAVCTIGGLGLVVFAALQRHALALDRLAIGMAGGVAVVLGILCLVGQRVMTHMHDALVLEKFGRARERQELAMSD